MKKIDHSASAVYSYLIIGSMMLFCIMNGFSRVKAIRENRNDSVVLKNTLSGVIVSAYAQSKEITHQPAAIFVFILR